MSPRANWKGFLKLGELSCPIALFTAASSSDRIAMAKAAKADRAKSDPAKAKSRQRAAPRRKAG
jgi:non-homologous end joining protein Ku